MLISIVCVFIISLGIIISTLILNNQKTESNGIPKIINLDFKTAQEYPKIRLLESDLKNEILWQENRPLTWKDFTGEVPDVGVHEETCAQIHMTLRSKTSLDFLDGAACYYFFTEVRNAGVFLKDKSWEEKERFLDCSITHEQGHFDISEVYARILTQKVIEETKGKAYLCPENGPASLRINIYNESEELTSKIFDTVISEFKTTNTKYENETDYGRSEEQEKWEMKIDGCLHGTWKNIEDCWK